MIQFSIVHGWQNLEQVECLVTNCFSDDVVNKSISDEFLIKLNNNYHDLIQRSVQRSELTGKVGESVFILDSKQSLILMGCGKKSNFNSLRQIPKSFGFDEFRMDEFKTWIARGFRECRRRRLDRIAFYFRGLEGCEHVIRSLVEAVYIANDSFRDFFTNKSKEPWNISKVDIVVDGKADLTQLNNELKKGECISESIHFMRRMINLPANHCTPKKFVEQAKKFVADTSIQVDVWGLDQIKAKKMNSFLAVAQGSVEEPQFLVLKYAPSVKKTDKKVALVGKGVTFDTGGISLKPANNMHEMKGDMSGGACVVSVIRALALLDCPVEVMSIIPLTDNMPSGSAVKPGDVVYAMNGKSIEILNTDAEGRLILADALCYAVEQKATHIVDVATLTGACVVALGEITTGLMSNDFKWSSQLIEACYKTGERIWPLPMFEKYRDQIKSQVADVANIGERHAGTITAAAFLQKFVDDRPWIHLDIAGTNWSSVSGELYSKGATGAMVSSLIEFVLSSKL